jgi:hypothetical protein
MSALIGGNADSVSIFLYGTVDDLIDRPVVAQVDDLNARILEHPSHDIDGDIMPIEKGCGGDNSYLVLWFILLFQLMIWIFINCTI